MTLKRQPLRHAWRHVHPLSKLTVEHGDEHKMIMH